MDRNRMYRYLGKTSLRLAAIGQGTTQTGGYAAKSNEKDRQRIEVLRLGLELGMNFIDTSELYGGGHAEEIVGEAVKGIRQQVFLASKFNPEHNTYQGVIRAAEGSLRRLQTDYLDLYQAHWPNPQVPLQETLGAMQTLVQHGKVRYIGVSNFTPGELRAARSLGMAAEISSCQMEYNLFERTMENEMFPYCQREGVTILAYSPLDRGAGLKNGPRLKLMQALAEKYEKTVAQITLRWLLSHPSVIALVKSASREHTQENAEAMCFDLLDEDLDQIDRLFEQNIIYVPPSRIRVNAKEIRSVYRSVEEALQNSLDLIPQPAQVALNIEKGHFLKPVPLTPSSDTRGVYDYDLVDLEILYWAWVIAKGMDEPLPAFVKYAY